MTKHKHIRALFDTAADEGEKISTAFSLDYSENLVRFSLSRCVIKKDVCLSNVTKSKELMQGLYRALGNLEKYTWRQIATLSRDDGISIEKKSDCMHGVLKVELPEASTFGHFRVENKEKKIFRVFGGRMNDLFYILYFDVDGKLQH
jgi:hypothetical protein